jgi:hypothetical protein
VALGYVAGILCGADKLSRVAWLQSDPALAATVNNPSGTMAAFRETKRRACLKLQKVSGVFGLTRSIFIDSDGSVPS